MWWETEVNERNIVIEAWCKYGSVNHTHVGLTQIGGEEVCILLLLDEDERLLRRLSRRLKVLKNRYELLPLGELSYFEEGLRHVGARSANYTHR